jgi:glycosyltransferase involved in cell wall biosynthesis
LKVVIMTNATLSAVICTRNRADLIAGAVSSVLENDDMDFELIVIDQSDSGDTSDALVALKDDPRLRYVHTTKVGLSAAYNTALALGDGDLFAFTDDDCLAPRDWLTKIRLEFARDPELDLVYGVVEAPAELLRLPGIVPTISFPKRQRISRRDDFLIAGMGANFAARRKAFETAGYFDEVLGGGGPLRSSQDFDLQFRLFRASGVSAVSPDFRVTHLGYRSPELWPQTMRAYGIGDGAFYMKHVRCGDGRACRILAGRMVLETIRTVGKPLLRHRRHSTEYLRGLVVGSWRSFGFSVDRRQRLYVTP